MSHVTVLGVFLLDDHEVVRTGLRALLEASDDIEVVGEAGTVAEALARIPADQAERGHPRRAAARRQRRGGLPRDPVAPARDRLRDAHVLRRRRGTDRVHHGGGGRATSSSRWAASTCSTPSAAPGRGSPCSTRSSTERVLERLRDGPEVDPRLASLTPQERRILDLIAEGYTNRQIAEAMFLAEKTVKNYVSNLLSKLGMERRTQAATFAARLNERSVQDARSDADGHLNVAPSARPGRHAGVRVG